MTVLTVSRSSLARDAVEALSRVARGGDDDGEEDPFQTVVLKNKSNRTRAVFFLVRKGHVRVASFVSPGKRVSVPWRVLPDDIACVAWLWRPDTPLVKWEHCKHAFLEHSTSSVVKVSAVPSLEGNEDVVYEPPFSEPLPSATPGATPSVSPNAPSVSPNAPSGTPEPASDDDWCIE